MYTLWVVFTLQALLLSPSLVNAGGMTFTKPQIRVTTTFSDFDARIMDHWGEGGGKWAKVSPRHPFAGRTFGGAKREEIRGTRAFGSGYPYGTGNHSTIARRPFPFGVWPLYWDQNFMNADEYGPHYDVVRPGGFIAYIPLRTSKAHFNVTDDEVYYAVGDRESLLPLMVSYVTWCHVTPAWPSRLNPSLPNATIKLENVVQYFRGSSFALASPGYNNTFARTTNSETKESTPLPGFMEYSPFRKCVDSVTENALAIMNTIPGETGVDRFVDALALGNVVVVGSMVIALGMIGALLLQMRKRFQLYLYGDPLLVQQARQNRQAEIQYERYP
ncbi:hypothetical protein FRC15_000442 [Serendipita sp. 397]|nr:hypothetical protein FRC15_000442 [Serendipita sp. 397]